MVRSGSCRAHEVNTALYGVALPALRHRAEVWLLLYAMHQARAPPSCLFTFHRELNHASAL